MGTLARPITWPQRSTVSPAAMSQSATLCPAGMASRVRTGRPSTLSSVPAGRATRAMATLSVGCRWIAEFPALGTLVISIGNGVAGQDREAFHAKFRAGGKGHPRDGDVVGGVQVDSGVPGVGDFGDFDREWRRGSGPGGLPR